MTQAINSYDWFNGPAYKSPTDRSVDVRLDGSVDFSSHSLRVTSVFGGKDYVGATGQAIDREGPEYDDFEFVSAGQLSIARLKGHGKTIHTWYTPSTVTPADIQQLVREKKFTQILRSSVVIYSLLSRKNDIESLIELEDERRVAPLFLALKTLFGNFYNPGEITFYSPENAVTMLSYRHNNWRPVEPTIQVTNSGSAVIPEEIIQTIEMSFRKVPLSLALQEQTFTVVKASDA